MSFATIVQPAYADHSLEAQALRPFGLDLRFVDGHASHDVLIKELSGTKLIFLRDTQLDGQVISGLSECKGIIRYGIGIDNIDLEAARAKGIVVSRVLDYGAEIEVADHTAALFLAARRRIVTRNTDVRSGAWQVGQAEPIPRIAGSTAGFVGFGKIARAVADRLRGFGINKFLAFDPFLKPEQAPDWVRLVSLEELAAQSDLISLHAPATPENRHIINRDILSRMRPTTILVNTARGPLIDEAALYEALNDRQLFAACLDVFETEPPQTSRLLELPNLIVTDHTAWYSEATVQAIQRGACEQAVEILEFGTASNQVFQV